MYWLEANFKVRLNLNRLDKLTCRDEQLYHCHLARLSLQLELVRLTCHDEFGALILGEGMGRVVQGNSDDAGLSVGVRCQWRLVPAVGATSHNVMEKHALFLAKQTASAEQIVRRLIVWGSARRFVQGETSVCRTKASPTNRGL